jgi:photosystem II stability/assembly factor-like uncharacterized protein
MIRRSLLFVALLSAANVSALPWSTHGPGHGPINALASSASNPRVIYASDAAAVFRSDDNGDHWRVVLQIRDVSLMAVDPCTPDTLYVAINRFDPRVLKSTDGGVTWKRLEALPQNLRPSVIVIDPAAPDTVYIGSTCAPMGFKDGVIGQTQFGEGVFKSTNGGATWTEVAPKPTGGYYACVEELALDPATPSHIFTTMSSFNRKQSASFDAASSWIAPVTPVPSNDVMPDVRYPLKRFGVTAEGKFLVSEDAGFQWREVETFGLPTGTGTLFTALEADPANGRLFLATNAGLFRSGDGGLHWAPVAGVPTIPISSMVFNPVDATITIGTLHGLMRVANPPAGPVTELDLGDVSTSPRIAGTDPKRSNVVYAEISDYNYGVVQSRFFRSSDYGNSWERFTPPTHDAGLRGVGSEGDLYATSFNREHLYFQEFGGSEWFELYTPLMRIDNVMVDRKVPGRIYAAGARYPGIVAAYRSVDNGNTWKEIAHGPAAIDPSNGATLFGYDDFFLAKSTDVGATWQRLENERITTYELHVAPSDSNVVYRSVRLFNLTAATELYRLQRSDDGGHTWTTLPFDMGSSFRTLAIHSLRARTLFVVRLAEVWRSDDGGATFTSVSDGLPGQLIVGGAAIDVAGRVLHIGLSRAGVWELPLAAPARPRTARH